MTIWRLPSLRVKARVLSMAHRALHSLSLTTSLTSPPAAPPPLTLLRCTGLLAILHIHTHQAPSCFRAFALAVLAAWYALSPAILVAPSLISLGLCTNVSFSGFPCPSHYPLENCPSDFYLFGDLSIFYFSPKHLSSSNTLDVFFA